MWRPSSPRFAEKDGTLRIWISENTRACAVRDENGKIVSYEGTVENITERKRSEFERQGNHGDRSRRERNRILTWTRFASPHAPRA